MGSFNGKMETTGTEADAVAQCCRHGNCCHHGSPLAIQGKRLSLKSKPNNDIRNSTKSVLKDYDHAKTGWFAAVQYAPCFRSFLCFLNIALNRCHIYHGYMQGRIKTKLGLMLLPRKVKSSQGCTVWHGMVVHPPTPPLPPRTGRRSRPCSLV